MVSIVGVALVSTLLEVLSRQIVITFAMNAMSFEFEIIVNLRYTLFKTSLRIDLRPESITT